MNDKFEEMGIAIARRFYRELRQAAEDAARQVVEAHIEIANDVGNDFHGSRTTANEIVKRIRARTATTPEPQQ